MAHYDSGRMLDAIAEVHKAKVNWFAKETLDGFILSLLILAHWYKELGLCFAGKYYSLTAASMAFNSSDPEIKAEAWRGFVQAAECEYAIGAWAGFLELTGMAVYFHYDLCPEAGNLSRHEELETIFFYGALAVVISERLSPGLADFVRTEGRRLEPRTAFR